jgi:hypothetical protein
MPTFVDTFAASVDAALGSARILPTDVLGIKTLTDDALLASQRSLAEARRAIDASAAVIAGEIAHRSRRSLGHSGLAQREGFRSPEALVQHETGSTARDATTLVKVGAMVHETLAPDAGGEPALAPWLSGVGREVAAGTISVEAAKAIGTGLGEPGEFLTVAQLSSAAAELLRLVPTMDVDQLLKSARSLRDDLDEAGIADRARQVYEQRMVRRTKRPNGLPRYIIDPDLESGAFLDDLFDKITSPRRSGPRFVSDDDKKWAEAVENDPRTTDQYLHDAVVQLLRIAVDAERTGTSRIVGSRQPSVRVLVNAEAFDGGAGHGRIEGVDMPIPIEMVQRTACTEGTVPLEFFEDQPLNLGREQRLFSPAQRIALAARDGGCRWPGCTAPASWTEAHHINEWKRDLGETNVADGILLCRFHHLLLHNNHWQVIRDLWGYWLRPPADVDSTRTLRAMPSKSAALHDYQRQRDTG